MGDQGGGLANDNSRMHPGQAQGEFLDLGMLDLIGPMRPESEAPSDALDRLIENCEFRFCPVLKAKLNIGCDTCT